MQGHKIELYIKCRQLKDKDTFTKSDPQVSIFLKFFNGREIEQKWTLVGKTEVLKDNLNPNFEKSFVMDYIFEVKQPIRFEVKDIDGDQSDDLGFAESTIGTLFGSRNQTCILSLNQGGKIITQIEKVQETQEFYTMKWSVRNLPKGCCSKPNPQLKFYKLKDQSELFTHETEKVGSTQAAIFNQFELWAGKLSDPYVVCIVDNQKLLGKVQIGLQEMNDRKIYNFQNGELKLEFFLSEIRPTFMDYLRGGLQINLSIAIDFTGSNLDQQDPKSLHYIHGNNQYLQALRTVGEILLAYDYDKQVPCFGFGAQLDYPQLKSQNVIHCFPLSGIPDNTNAVGIEGIEQLYEYSLQHLTFGGPTYFAPILNETTKIAEQIKNTEQNEVYLVFMILTDGIIHDMDETIQLLRVAQFLPMSIIIIGVGDEDFSLMKQLDNDNGSLGFKRDIVQFVPFRQFNNPVLLAKEVLAELPDQLLNYMKIQGIKPRAPQEFIQI